MGNFFKHLKTICQHKRQVRKLCFRIGLYWQGITHDLSKFSWQEFAPGVKYYLGYKSPQVKERQVLGYSAAWLHHKGRNKHHYEYWRDITDSKDVKIKMPPKYFCEMFCDRVAATKVYLKKDYTLDAPLNYFLTKTNRNGMHEETANDLEYYLRMLAEKGEKQTFQALKQYLKDNKKKKGTV